MAKTTTFIVAPMGINEPRANAKLLTGNTQKALTAAGLINNNTSSTLSSGGQAASQAAAAQAQKERAAAQANSIRNAMGVNNVINQLAPLATPSLDRDKLSKYATPADTSSNNGGGGGGGGSLSVSQSVSEPYADIYSIYDQMLASQENALAQQRAARLNALQANYNNAKSQLDSSFNAGETEMNQSADKALREAYINNMLNQRNMNQYLAGQGITGGAAESILANLYNTYGNSRNSIEQNRMDQLRQLLANYQGTLGDIENSYLRGMADADSDYSGSIADALTNYYSKRADLLKQNIANQYKVALGKSGSGNSGSTDTNMKNLINTVKQFKSNPAYALQVIEEAGYSGSDADYILQQSGIVPSEARSFVNKNVRNSILNELERVVDNARANNVPDSAENIVNQTMLRLVREYGLTDEQARAILEEAGY